MKLIQAIRRCAMVLPVITAEAEPLAKNASSCFVLVVAS